MSNLDAMTLQLTITNGSKHAIRYDHDTDTKTIEAGAPPVTIPITFSETTQFTFTDLSDSTEPLRVTLDQTGEDSADISASGAGWSITPTDEELLCGIATGRTTRDVITLPITATSDAIVIVGTIEIGDFAIK